MVNDVEKRFSDDRTFRGAATYALAVIAVAAAVFAITTIWAANRAACSTADTTLCDTPAKTAVLLGPTAVLLLGGIGAFVRTYQQWRHGRNWPIWQGAGWFLFMLMTVYLAIGGGSVAG
ncbi:hypothetical protein [Nocardia australiensis]|uniref:hypothetical protein n=1 Tax=Nocardia australiensis TaxID=2887191 RepID=UPI001D15922F|nr:hypothetical protein [Nocardia australiensis]